MSDSTTHNCVNCKKTISDDSLFCPHCGIKAELSKAYYPKIEKKEGRDLCSGCKKPAEAGTKFCQFCGKKIIHSTRVISYCPRCNAVVNSGAEKCKNCGSMLEVTEQGHSLIGSIFTGWRMTGAETQRQLDLYDKLSWQESYRKISALCLIVSLVLTAVLSQLIGLTFLGMIINVVIYGTLAIFAYRGHRWAFISAIILWTYEKGYQLVERASVDSGTNGWFVIMVFFWWALYIKFFSKAFYIEQLRHKR